MAAERKSTDDTVGDDGEAACARLPLNFHPGDRWEYGRATDVVGRLVEVMSGRSLDDLPAASESSSRSTWSDTHFYLPQSKLDRFAALYGPGEAQGTIVLTEAPTAESRFVARAARLLQRGGRAWCRRRATTSASTR